MSNEEFESVHFRPYNFRASPSLVRNTLNESLNNIRGRNSSSKPIDEVEPAAIASVGTILQE